jgi:hypothetical protein
LINHLILRDYEPDLSDEPPRGCLETSPPLSAGHYSAAVWLSRARTPSSPSPEDGGGLLAENQGTSQAVKPAPDSNSRDPEFEDLHHKIRHKFARPRTE